MTGKAMGRAAAVAGLVALLVGVTGGADHAMAWGRGGGGFHRHGHGFHGPHFFAGPRFFFGARVYGYPYPYYYPYYGYAYPYPYYAYPPYPEDYVAPPAPPPPAASVTPPAYWYYCSDPPGYYPTVGQCPGGWVQVPPRPGS